MEERHARIASRGPAPQAKAVVVMPLERVWHALPADERQQILKTISQIIAKQLPVPPAEREVPSESC
jgi:hypothetical protein